MKSSEIWKAANEKLVFVGVLFTWLQDDPENPLIGVWATKLKKMLPCFIGIDPEKKALIFQSEDDGIVGLYMNRIDEKSISLYMETGLVLEN